MRWTASTDDSRVGDRLIVTVGTDSVVLLRLRKGFRISQEAEEAERSIDGRDACSFSSSCGRLVSIAVEDRLCSAPLAM